MDWLLNRWEHVGQQMSTPTDPPRNPIIRLSPTTLGVISDIIHVTFIVGMALMIMGSGMAMLGFLTL